MTPLERGDQRSPLGTLDRRDISPRGGRRARVALTQRIPLTHHGRARIIRAAISPREG